MSKQFKGFLWGMFILIVAFFITVSIMGAVNNRNFVEEIKSWGDSEQQEIVDDTTNDNTSDEEGSSEETDGEEQTPESTEAVYEGFKVLIDENTAVITI